MCIYEFKLVNDVDVQFSELVKGSHEIKQMHIYAARDIKLKKHIYTIYNIIAYKIGCGGLEFNDGFKKCITNLKNCFKHCLEVTFILFLLLSIHCYFI